MVGGIYAGNVHRLIPERWRDLKDVVSSERRRWYEKHDAKPWRAWIMTDDEGQEVGRYASERDAMAALEAKVIDLLN